MEEENLRKEPEKKKPPRWSIQYKIRNDHKKGVAEDDANTVIEYRKVWEKRRTSTTV